MIVLDYIKKMRDSKLVIPPFHTGHLGLLPETEVSIGVMTRNESPRHCELVISPFDDDTKETVLIKCKLHDMIGVVGRLIESISVLGINIIKQESSSVDHLKHHSISLLIDTSDKRPNIAHPSTTDIYCDYNRIFPTHDYRYVEIFESIVGHVGDALVWREISGKHYPDLSIQPLVQKRLRKARTAKVKKHTNRSVSISLPPVIRSTLRSHLGPDEPRYILLSETEQRTLRAFFPQPEMLANTVHLGFYHSDEPSELLPIIKSLAAAGFNILTSLLRKYDQEENRSVWEAVLEYRGQDRMPRGASKSAWLAYQIETAAEKLERNQKSDFEIGKPRYPYKRDLPHVQVRLRKTKRKVKRKRDALLADLEERHANLRANAEALGLDDNDLQPREELLDLVTERINKGPKRIIFLSYPKSATRHARALKKQLAKTYKTIDYQLPDGEDITTQVVDKIHRSDYFVGIWDHDRSLPTREDRYNVSPWMPFEYGVALSAGKKAIVVYSDKTDERIYSRINAGVANPKYSDLDHFTGVTIPLILRYCRRHFR